MISAASFKKLALSFPEAEEQPHFEKASFRVRGKIFATLDVTGQRAVLKLSEIDQSVFCSVSNKAIYPVNGAWGRKGWTAFELRKIKMEVLKDALTCSYRITAPKKLAEQLLDKES